MDFIRHNKPLVITGSIITIALAMVFNVYFYIFLPIQSQGNPTTFIATPSLEDTEKLIPTPSPIQSMSTLSLVALFIGLLIAILAIIIVLAYVRHSRNQQYKRDERRKADLAVIAQGFEAYRDVHGHYPLSSTYQPAYYTGINLSNDWNYYGLPNKEQMGKFIPGWPISDPKINYMDKVQVNQYLYYPKANGQTFFLYAHLETPTKDEEIDYNKQDNLLRAWGAYNYRVVSQHQHDDHSEQAVRPAEWSQPQALAVETSSTPATMQPAQAQYSTPAAPLPNASPSGAPVVMSTLAPQESLTAETNPSPISSLQSVADGQPFQPDYHSSNPVEPIMPSAQAAANDQSSQDQDLYIEDQNLTDQS